MERTKYKNRIWAELRKRGIKADGRDLRTNSGKAWLRSLEIDTIEDYLELIGTLNERILKLEGEIRENAEENEEARLLMTIPGVSYYSALTIIAEIATIERFPNSERLCSYAGLVPSTRQSRHTETHGSIQGGRPLLRWIMIQSSWNHIRNAKNSHITRFYERLKRKKPKQKAIIATAQKLLKAVYWMLKLKEEFHPEGYDPRSSR